MKYNEWLMHFNPNHDPRNGQFARSGGGSSHVSKSVFKSRRIAHEGENVEFELRDNSVLARALGKIFPGIKRTLDNAFCYNIQDKSGNDVGYMELERIDNDTLYGSWITIDDDQRGKGYAQSAMRMVLSEAKKNGFKRMTIEVPGISPDARHIYEKYGFEVSKEQLADYDESDAWGGLTRMEQKL